MDGRDSGWSDVAGAVECYLWCARLDIRTHYSRSSAQRTSGMANLRHTLTPAVVLLAYFVAVDQKQREQSLWSPPAASPDRPAPADPPVVERAPLRAVLRPPLRPGPQAPGAARPWAVQAARLRPGHGRLGRRKALAKSLQRACEYHCRRMAHTRSWTAEFNRTPLDLLPVEIFAINALRSAMGMNPVEVDHPLMRTSAPSAWLTRRRS